MSTPAEPDWRRMPASAVRLKLGGPEFVELRAKDARTHAEGCRQYADARDQEAKVWANIAADAQADAERWERAAEAFRGSWTDEP